MTLASELAHLGLDHNDSVALLSRQTAVLERIAAGAPLGEVLTEVALTLELLVPACQCSILLLEPATATLRHGAAPSLPDTYLAGIDGLAIGREVGSCGSAAYLGVQVVAEDIRTDPRWAAFRDLADRHELRSCWSTPICSRGAVLGTFAVYHGQPHHPSGREQRLVDHLTHLASVAIEHHGLFGALADSEERFRRAFEDNVVGMALTDPDGVVTRVNHAMLELLGCSETTLIGSSLDVLFPPDRGRAEVGEDRYPTEYGATARHTNGRRVEVLVSVSPVRGADQRPLRLSVTVLDVTGRRAAERERRRRHEAEVAKRTAEAASRAKSDFVCALGHELRTPLQAITGFTELLGSLDLPAERRSAALEHIDAASNHILSLVDDVLDVARIEAGALPLNPSSQVLDVVITDVVSLLEPLAQAVQVSLGRSGKFGRTAAYADGRRLKQVLLNLLSNGLRYNRPGGSVEIGCSKDSTSVTITVRDSGPGIAAEHLPRLFTPFDRLGVESAQGVGLGLPLARGLTAAMGGRLEVSSAVGEGTTVSFTLPRAL